MNVLICSQYGECQVEQVCLNLKSLGVNPVLFERYRKDQFVSYKYGNKVQAIFRDDHREYSLDSKTFPTVWYRPKPILLSEIPGERDEISEKFCMQEWRVLIQSLESILIESKWINPILNNHMAANKAYQLKLAQQLGLQIPRTIITNQAEQTYPLFRHGRVIYKTLSSFFTAKTAIYTNEITYDQVIDNKIQISMAPGIFQNYIDKQHELRVTVVGQQIFCIKINSQTSKSSSVDWRRSPTSDMYDLGELSSTTSAKLLSLHKHLGLIYAAYDFIVDVHNNEIFIECNPTGQWLWLEDKLSINISQSVVNELLGA